MNRAEHLLSCLAEECAEDREGILPPLHLDAEILGMFVTNKRAKIEKFMAISREQGVLSE